MMKFLGVLLLVFAVLQLLQPSRTNPPSPHAQSVFARSRITPEAGRVLARSCTDCHSNQTVWPWYSKVAPMSWVVADDVRDGRSHLNLSEWGRYDAPERATLLRKICREVKQGGMPLWSYRMIHSGTALSSAERAAICDWTSLELQAMGAPLTQQADSERK